MSHPPDPSAALPGAFSHTGTCSPHAKLLTHYFLLCLLSGPGFLVAFPLCFFRYYTLRYRFDADGVTMTVGILFRREVALTYRRIQDIHVTRGIIQRWLGLATVACQTASGSSSPELVIEGLMDHERVRDFLYQQMRGARGEHPLPLQRERVDEALRGRERVPSGDAPASPAYAADPGRPDEALVLLTEIRDRLGALTREVEALRAASVKEPPHGR